MHDDRGEINALLGHGTEFSGKLTYQGTVRIDGVFSGEIKTVLRDLGIEAGHLRRLVIVAFEAEMNVVMYARKGVMTLVVTDDDIRLETTDEGPGIPDIDLFEHNEAYSTASIVIERELGIPAEKMNVNGGAVAMGHPIGCSGARLLSTLIYALRDRGLRSGLAALCLGGGEAVAMAVEAEE